MNLKKIISQKDYNTFAGPDWPSFNDITEGIPSADSSIQNEVNEFIGMMQQTYSEITLSGSILAKSNQQRQNQIFFNKNYHDQPTCQVPWDTLSVNSNGEMFICSCSSWVPVSIGNILHTTDIYDVLNSESAQLIRQEIIAGRYFYCNNQICGFFKKVNPTRYQGVPQPTDTPMGIVDKDQLLVSEIPKNLIFNFDYTCNFRCPSCRTELINNNKHYVIRSINDQIVCKIKHLVIDRIQSEPVVIVWGGGEPFISDVYLELMEYILSTGKQNIRHVIQTNGSYLKAKSEMLKKLLPTLDELRISFDAATEETYKKIRVNGQWNQLLKNVQWLQDLIQQSQLPLKIRADFVVQLDNYKEIPAFVKLCEQLGITTINFQKMWNWGTWPAEEFAKKNIYNPDHPQYDKLVEIFKQSDREILF
jgi:sulfatase maturation enzyme AslB (radical SAM superfamily)